MDYKDKYLKYRQKYLRLKHQLGGAKCDICDGEHLTEYCPKRAILFPSGSSNSSGSSGSSGSAAAAAPVAPVAAEDDWTTVAPRPRRTAVQRQPPPNIPYDELIRILREKLARYGGDIEAGYVYGSRARGNNKPTSDADVIIFWRRMPDVETLKEIRAEIEAALGIEIDFVSCYYTRGFIEHVDQRDEAYFGNVIGDARQFMGQSINIANLIEYSKKMPKLRR
jgi:predicted nucleotidyltransferase